MAARVIDGCEGIKRCLGEGCQSWRRAKGRAKKGKGSRNAGDGAENGFGATLV
jgi:hypothetical protein